MAFVKVVGILRTTCVDQVERALCDIHVPGMTVIRVKGFGDYANFFRNDLMDEHARFEVLVPEERSEEVARVMMEAAYSGSAGDGLVTIEPVARAFKVRKQAEAAPEDL
ncbi:MAG TPA: P-II family nitrogen regulator [Gammaproteobacteria bacterium]|nr:P-II family nitrogen regulator [Gammaproteobacteria bacterium]